MNPVLFQKIKDEINDRLSSSAKDAEWEPIEPVEQDQTARWMYSSTEPGTRYRIECEIKQEPFSVKADGIEEPFLVCEFKRLPTDGVKRKSRWLLSQIPNLASRKGMLDWVGQQFNDLLPPKQSKT